jgi:hypothetical protein
MIEDSDGRMDICRFWLFIETLPKPVLSPRSRRTDDDFTPKKTWTGVGKRPRESALCHFEENFSERLHVFHRT